MRNARGCFRAGAVLALSSLAIVLSARLGSAADGDLDTTFSKDGIREINQTPTDIQDSCCEDAYGVAIQPDGKIVVAGSHPGVPSDGVSGGSSIVFRLNHGGSFDQSFGTGGETITNFGTPSKRDWTTAWDVAIDGKGRIVTVGTFRQDFVVARYTTGGELDPRFSGDGMIFTNFGGRDVGARLAIQPDNKIVVVGSTSVPGSFDPKVAIVRYTANGKRDPTFNGDGKEVVDDVHTDAFRDQAVAIQSDGGIVVGAVEGTGYALIRLLTGGGLDPAFGTGGIAHTSAIGSDGYLSGTDMALQGDRIVVSGNVGPFPDGEDFAVARFDGQGNLDTTFGQNGTARADIRGFDDSSDTVAVQAGGKIVLGGTGREDGTIDSRYLLALARFDANGRPDTSFGVGGVVATPFSLQFAGANSVAVGGGKIVAAGFSEDTGTLDEAYAVARYLG
jgi:uncharacterized delta-60 repeat protein